jgi:hypothetical protein
MDGHHQTPKPRLREQFRAVGRGELVKHPHRKILLVLDSLFHPLSLNDVSTGHGATGSDHSARWQGRQGSDDATTRHARH